MSGENPFHAAASVLLKMTPKPPMMMEAEAPSERAVYSIDMGVADLFIAVLACKTTDDALRLSQLIEPLVLKLEAAQSAALHKADALSGASR